MLEQFAAIDQSFEDFSLSHKEAVLEQPFKHVRKRISEFQQETEAYLAQLLREQLPVEPRPGPSRPAPASRKRVVKTRFKGTVVGEVRPSASGQPVLLDVKSPMTGKVIATFHEKTPGVWVERVQPRRRHPTAPGARPRDANRSRPDVARGRGKLHSANRSERKKAWPYTGGNRGVVPAQSRATRQKRQDTGTDPDRFEYNDLHDSAGDAIERRRAIDSMPRATGYGSR